MNWDRMLALIGILLGIPGVLLLFLSDKWAHGVLALLLVCVCLAWFIYIAWRDKQPVFTVLLREKRLCITDPEGRVATFSRKQRVRINHKGVTEWWCRNLAADGPITNILIDGHPPDITNNAGGTIQVCRRFPYPKQRGEIWESILTYNVTDSYLKPCEETIHYTAFKTKKLVVEVSLPRPCRRAEMRFTFAGEQAELLPPPKVSENSQEISAEIKSPRMGGQYHVIWEW